MSTAIVSAFYDVGDVLYQVQKNRNCQRSHSHMNSTMDRKIVGSPVLPPNFNNNRNKNSRANSTSALSTGTSKLNHHLCSHQHTNSTSSNNMISFNNSQQQFINQDKINKLNRTMSEPSPIVPPPAERNNNNHSPTSTRSSQNNVQQQQPGSGGNNPNVNSSRYKTELCRPFEENGHCKYGDKCQFAHGADELRCLPRHPKYKTERCRTFHTSGFCPYGPRCHFIHNEDELKLTQLKQQRAEQQQQQRHSMPPSSMSSSPQQPVPQRPSALNISYNSSMSLGSTADSPASSVTDSPSMSPTFMFGDYYDELADAFSSPVPASAPVVSNSSSAFPFNLQDLQAAMPGNNSPVMAPLNVQTDPLGLQAVAASLNKHNQQNNTYSMFQDCRPSCSSTYDVFGCPSPPDSLSGDSAASSDISVPSSCSSLLDLSRGLRLPIFSQLSEL